jgi:hypothetical protein
MARMSSALLRAASVSLTICGYQSVLGCATPAQVGEYPNQLAMLGKTKADVVQCAGVPHKERRDGGVTLLPYYREAPMLKESRASFKGSMPTMHHGCWATVILTDDRVTEVRYRFVPDTFDASDECEKIFEQCVP